jgi:hypothetical protein
MNAFPPLTKLSASAYTDFGCAACGQSLKAGERLTVIPLGPGDDVSERDRARAGRWYNAVAVIAHADCGGLPPIGPMAEDAADDEDAKGPMDHEHSDDSENQEPAA